MVIWHACRQMPNLIWISKMKSYTFFSSVNGNNSEWNSKIKNQGMDVSSLICVWETDSLVSWSTYKCLSNVSYGIHFEKSFFT